MLLLFFKLLIGHAVADYPLQGDTMVKGKNRHNPIWGVPWWYWLTAHSLINAGAVLVITGNGWCAVTEFVLHWVIDFSKCDNWINPHGDQFLHVLCKLGYALAL